MLLLELMGLWRCCSPQQLWVAVAAADDEVVAAGVLKSAGECVVATLMLWHPREVMLLLQQQRLERGILGAGQCPQRSLG